VRNSAYGGVAGFLTIQSGWGRSFWAAFAATGGSMRKPLPHGSDGCFRFRRAPAWQDQSQPGYHREVWELLNWASRKGFSSELEAGAMLIELSWVERRMRLVDSLDRLASRYPQCIKRVAETAWALPCPKCGGANFLAIVV
jgi:hypothetical protein